MRSARYLKHSRMEPLPMRRLVPSLLLALCVGFGYSAPASAGTVYVAFAADTSFGGLSYESVLRVTNTGTEPHFFTVHFIPSFSDGTAREGLAEPTLIGIPGGHTYVYENLSLGSGSSGMLEVTGDDELVFSAAVVFRNAQGVGEEFPVPVIGSDQVVRAGQRMVVQGVRRDADHLTSFGILNLAQETIQCEVDLVAASGQELMSTAVLALQPLSQFFYHDVISVVSLPSAADARFETVCNGPAFTFGKVVNFTTGNVAPIQLSASLSSALFPPGHEPPEPAPGECTGSFCFELPGTFFVPTGSNRVHKVPVPVPKGKAYTRLDIEMTVTHGGWFAGNPGGFHNFFWLFDGQWANGTWGYVNARGPGKGIVTSLHNVNIPKGRRATGSLLLQPGATYRLRYSYDTRLGLIETTFSDAAGNVLARMTDAPPVNRLVFGTDAGAWLWFGLEGHFEEVPSFGWQYKNFVLSLSE